MDTRTQFVISFIILGVVVFGLIISLLLGLTRNNTDQVDIQPTNLESFDDINTGIPGVASNIEPETEQVIAEITLADPVVVENEVIIELEDISIINETYRVRFIGSWNSTSHSNWIPNGPHFSPMFVWSHNLKDKVWKLGELATRGVEIMAETGAPPTLTAELEVLKEEGIVLDFSVGKRIDAPGEDEVVIEVSTSHPMISFVSMLAPSPDWFVAESNIKLYENGEWIESKVIDLTIYDAGTDSGTRFTSPNRDSGQLISLHPNPPTTPIGSIEITRL